MRLETVAIVNLIPISPGETAARPETRTLYREISGRLRWYDGDFPVSQVDLEIQSAIRTAFYLWGRTYNLKIKYP